MVAKTARLRFALAVNVALLALAAYGGGAPVVEPLGSVSGAFSFQFPAQIRLRYGFSGLPLTPEAQGYGQLIAIISSYNNPVAAESLATFSEKFGLNQCDTVHTTYLPDANGGTTARIVRPQAGQRCTFQSINLTDFGHPFSGEFRDDPLWTMESTMDLEWAHAIAPQSSLLLVQVPDALPGALANAARFASEVAKADVVSMSFGAAESSVQCPREPGKHGSSAVKKDPFCDDDSISRNYWKAFESHFQGGATFVAASGDRALANWPAIHPNVLAVGGTVLGRTETGWVGSGGGLSSSFEASAAQASVTGLKHRAVPDVAYGAGTPIAVYIKPTNAFNRNGTIHRLADAACLNGGGGEGCGWYAGLIAVVNATRKAQGLFSLDFISSLYSDIASVPTAYTAAFADVVSGDSRLNGELHHTSKTGYDLVTGLGVPMAANLVRYLAAP